MKILTALLSIWTVFLVCGSQGRALSTDTSHIPDGYSVDNRSIVLELRLRPAWNFDEAWKFMGDWKAGRQDMIRVALYGVEAILSKAIEILNHDGAANPSFQRYFFQEDMEPLKEIFALLLAYLGAPNTEELRRCHLEDIGPVFLHDLDRFAQEECEEDDNIDAGHITAETFGVTTEHIIFCDPYWNDVYKLHKYMPHMPEARYVHKEWVGPHIDAKEPGGGFAVESGASVFLHEMLHWDALTKHILSKVPQPDAVKGLTYIDDQKLRRPNTRKRPKAYNSFFSQKVKDPAWQSPQGPLFNVDNYVMLCLELYYGAEFGIATWTEAPDPRAPPPPDETPDAPDAPEIDDVHGIE